MEKVDVVVIGAGAAGLMCAIEAGKRARKVIILDHANKVGKKILMSGGGRCNFTNLYAKPENYVSHNPHFCKSALNRYAPKDFIDLVKKHHISYHEKAKGQLFCDNKSQDIVDMLLLECKKYNVTICINTKIDSIKKQSDNYFKINSSRGAIHSQSLVVACGGLSIPTMGASPYGYKIAEQFGIRVWPTRAGLVPLTLHRKDKEKLSELSGISIDCVVRSTHKSFRENLLFTHRGLSGPAILQISSYWQPGEKLVINMLPESDLIAILKNAQQQEPLKLLKSILIEYLPKRVIETFLEPELVKMKLHSMHPRELLKISKDLSEWKILPNGTEGYRTAEVTLGGVDCDAISSKTFESNQHLGLYFIGEVLDVTGWLGGFNFQWAWASGWAAGQVV